MSETILNNKCEICGDRANGFNFNVLSCESCKAFFRRNAPKQTELKCIFNGKCEIDKKNRKLCRFCRLNKCIIRGMKKEWILSDEQKKVRKNIRKENNRNRKKAIHKIIHKTIVIENSSTDSLSDQSIQFETSPQQSQTLGAFDYSDSSPESLVEEFSSIDTTSDDSIEITKETPTKEMQNLSIVPISRPITDYRNNLTEIEGNYLTELLNATKILKTPYGSITSEATTFIDAMHVLIGARADDIRRYYQMSKDLIGYKNICRSDQFSLLCPGFVESFFMRNVVGYFNDNDSEYFVIPTDSEKSSTCLISLNLFRETKPFLYEANRNYYQKISREWDSDQIILDLLTAIVLFNPDRCRIFDQQTIRFQQHVYKYLLQRYLLLKYRSEGEAKAKYSRLLRTIEYLHILFASNIQIVCEENILEKGRWHSELERLGL